MFPSERWLLKTQNKIKSKLTLHLIVKNTFSQDINKVIKKSFKREVSNEMSRGVQSLLTPGSILLHPPPVPALLILMSKAYHLFSLNIFSMQLMTISQHIFNLWIDPIKTRDNAQFNLALISSYLTATF